VELESIKEQIWDLSLPELIMVWEGMEQQHGIDAVRELCKVDRYYLLVRACGRVDALHPWIFARCREVERNPNDMLDLWAREHYKSTVITFAGTIQEILRNPEITIAIFSHTKGIARKFFRQIRYELETNQTLLKAFPDILWENTRQAPRWAEETGLVVKRKTNPKERHQA
jgi:hypothetical protein